MLHGTPESASTRESRLATVRNRLVVALLVEFVALMGVAAIGGFWPGSGLGREGALIVIAGAALVAPLVMAYLARRVLAAVEALDAEREALTDLYTRARNDSLVDALTTLGNHRAFQEELALQLEHARRHDLSLALMLIDVDDLKKVNDEQGHAGGDELLAAVGRVAMSVLRRSDRAFRVGGDEFVVLLPQSDVDTGLAVARRMLASALAGGDPSQPIAPFSLSIGVSAFPNPAAEGQQLYRQADAALYWCKRHGRTAVVAYDPGHHGIEGDGRSVAERSSAISHVLAHRSVRPVYQPIFSLETGDVIGYEGLVRPNDDAPFSDAAAMFAAAEVADRTVELDLVCLEAVATGAGRLEPGIYLGVNVSPRTLGSELFHPTELIAILRRRGIAPAQVLLELTEREEVEDLEQLRHNVQACRQAGFRLAADDVGAGNAGLRLLSEIHFDTVKVDLSLVQGGVVHDPSHAVLRALQELAARWGASIVAEGVETAEQLSVIRELGIGAAQGYLLGRPARERRAERLDLDALSAPAWMSDTEIGAA
jgi:diguanylate cyclase (GGDEF)-like protein